MMEQQKKSDSFPFFKFKNKETEAELKRLVSQYEGILPEKVEGYLSLCHSNRMAELFVESKNYLKNFWESHREINLTEFIGLINFAMLDIQLERIKKGENLAEIFKQLAKR